MLQFDPNDSEEMAFTLHKAMMAPNTVVLVVRYLNVDLEIDREPNLTP